MAVEHLLEAPATPAAAALFLGVSLGTQASKFSYYIKYTYFLRVSYILVVCLN